MEQGGPQALRAKPRGGRHPFVPPERLDDLGEILSRGALSFGYDTDLWTLPRVARVLEKEWGVHYSHSGVWLLLKKHELASFAPHDLGELKRGVRLAVMRMRDRPMLLRQLARSSELS